MPGCELPCHKGKSRPLVIFLKDSEAVESAEAWVATVCEYVAIRDCLALSFALDYRVEAGDPDGAKTKIGNLCRRAKPYEREDRWDQAAADELAECCLDALRELTCYDTADCVVAVPPSRPDKPFDLPRHLARRIAAALGKVDLSDAVSTRSARNQLKGLPVADKLDELKGTVEVDASMFTGMTVLLLDDLYQSGTSMNYVAMLLLQAGAKKIFGLACEKTLRNDDNVSGRAVR